MMLPRLSNKQEKERILNHELGHWFAATHYDFHIDHVAFEGNDHEVKSGYVNMYPRPKIENITHMEEYLLSRIVILCAGAVKDDAWYNDLHPLTEDQRSKLFNTGLINKTGLSDRSKISEHLPLISAIRFGVSNNKTEEDERFSIILNEAWQEAAEILSPNEKILDLMLRTMLAKSEGYYTYSFTNQEMRDMQVEATSQLSNTQ